MAENNGNGDPLRKVVDSTVAIAFARFFMPIAMAVIGWFMVNSFSELKASNEKLWQAFADISKIVNKQTTDVAVVSTKTDALAKSVDKLSITVDTIKQRP